MRYSRVFARLLLIFLIPSLVVYPQATIPVVQTNQEAILSFLTWDNQLSYDAVLDLIEKIEEDELDGYTEKDMERIEHFLISLALEGTLPNETQERLALERDIEFLLSGNASQYYFACDHGDDGFFFPAIFDGQQEIVHCKSWLKKQWDNTRHFVKKHKTAIIIGAAVIATAAVLTFVVISASAVAAGAASAAAAASNKGEKKVSVPPASIDTPTEIPSTSFAKQNPQVQSVIEEKIVSFKERLADEPSLLSDLKNQSAYSIEQNGRILGSAFAHQTLNEIGDVSQTTEAHYEIDRAFSTDYTAHYLQAPSTDDFSDVYQFRGKYAHDIMSYDQAIVDLGRAIELNPNNNEAYLERATVYFDKGDFDRSIKDYHQYTSRRAPPVKNTVDFSKGFAKGFSKGAVESSRQLISFASNCVAHPINTGREMWNTVFLLKELAHSQDWEVIAQALVPEVHQLITQWDVLSPQQQGELAGFAFGKYGMDFIAPGALSKTISKGAKGTKELAEICKSLKNAENTLTLEALATAGKPGVKARLSELRATERSTIMAKELIALETGEEVISEAARNQWKVFFDAAEAKLRPDSKKPLPEMEVRQKIHAVGIKTFPRPNGIPEDYIVSITSKSGGMEYKHPTNTHLTVRVMPGKPHSDFQCQRKPYVIQKKDGYAFDKYGNKVILNSPECHIPLEEFIYMKN